LTIKNGNGTILTLNLNVHFNNAKHKGGDMRKLIILLSLVIVAITLMTGCASTGKHVKDTVDNVQEYALFGDEYTRW